MKKHCEELGIKPLLAVKGFPLALVFDKISSYICGSSASGLFEVLLGQYIGKENHVHSPAYRPDEIENVLKNCDHIVFNSASQWEQYKNIIKSKFPHVSPGIRINPEYSEILVDKYNTCLPNSRFGINNLNLEQLDMSGIEGLHLHVMCDQGAETFLNVINIIQEKFGPYLSKVKWINFGGGHQLANDDYDYEILKQPLLQIRSKYNLEIYVEPCESIVNNCGYLVTRVLDIVKNVAILDTSASCHMPDILETPYVPDIVFPTVSKNGKFEYTFAGASCMAGDVIGKYKLIKELKVDDKIVFSDMGAYTFAKESYFNGINHPAIVLYEQKKGLQIVKRFTYEDYLKNFY